MTAETMSETAARSETIHPGWVRVCHWINAIAILVMIGSGWQIFNAAPLFDFSFPRGIALGNWLGGALLWHFAAMWLLVINGLVYVTLGFATGRFRRKLWPIVAVRDFRRHQGRAYLQARARRPLALQRRAEGALCRHLARRRGDRHLGP